MSWTSALWAKISPMGNILSSNFAIRLNFLSTQKILFLKISWTSALWARVKISWGGDYLKKKRGQKVKTTTYGGHFCWIFLMGDKISRPVHLRAISELDPFSLTLDMPLLVQNLTTLSMDSLGCRATSTVQDLITYCVAETSSANLNNNNHLN